MVIYIGTIMGFKRFSVGLILLVTSCITFADDALLKNREARVFIDDMVKNYHFSKQELVSMFKEAKYQGKILELMEKPYEKKSWDTYKQLFLTQNRLDSAIEFWNKNKKVLTEVEQKYGVPADIIMAILGVETLYGKRQGDYRVLDSLTTLAFYYPKRAPFFTKELREYLILCREQHVSPLKYQGSYAGAIGMPQFMPSSYRYYAVTADGKNGADLMTKDTDVVHSIANYFVKNGWQKGGEVAEPAVVSGLDFRKIDTSARSASYPFTYILSKGVRPKISKMQHPAKAGVIELTTDNGNEYWLGYHNFYVITRYNTSPQYALVVYLFANQIREKRLQHA